MVDNFVQGLLVTFAIDVIIFFVLFFVYIKVKDLRSKHLDP
jgi:hypothetical protein